MEKGFICIILLVMIIFSSCSQAKKETLPAQDQYVEGWTRVLGVNHTNKDTSSTKYMQARIEALAVDEDTQLKAELISWTPLPGGNAKYEIKMTNKTNCQMILRWNWENLNPVISIEPNDTTAGTLQADVIKANQIKTYFFIARAMPGKIFVKSEKSNSTCEPSRQLKIEITTTILPIEFTGSATSRVGDQMVVQWSTDTPGDVDTFFVMWTPTGRKEDEVCKYILGCDKITKKYTITFPAIKKIK